MRIQKATVLKEKPQDENKLGFGQVYTDHMLMMDYSPQEGWHDMRIVPYQSLPLDPACMALHYGQAIFEGLKAYKGKDGQIRLFRPSSNFERMNRSGERLCIPPINVDEAVKGLEELIRIEQDWIPTAPNTSLYIRPTIIATDAHLGVRASNTYLFYIILSPVGPYYKEGLNPVKIFVEDEYVLPAYPRRARRHRLYQMRGQLCSQPYRKRARQRGGLFPGALAGRRRAQIC